MRQLFASLFLIASAAFGQARINGDRTIDGAINTCTDAGSNDTYACSISPAPAALRTGTIYTFKAATANTGAATINFNSLGAKTIKKVAGGITTDLSDNDIRAGQWVSVIYDGTNMQMLSALGNSGGGSSSTYGAYASLPGSCNDGDQYRTSDSVYAFQCSSSAWLPFRADEKVTLPPTSGWTWDNQGSASASTTYGYVLLQVPSAGGTALRAYYRTAPSAPYIVKMQIDHNMASFGSASGTDMAYGLGFRDSSGKLVVQLLQSNSGGWSANVFNWNSSSSINAAAITRGATPPGVDLISRHPIWLAIRDDNTNLHWYWSLTGVGTPGTSGGWHSFGSVGRTAFMGSGPTQYCVIAYPNNGDMQVQINSLEEL